VIRYPSRFEQLRSEARSRYATRIGNRLNPAKARGMSRFRFSQYRRTVERDLLGLADPRRFKPRLGWRQRRLMNKLLNALSAWGEANDWRTEEDCDDVEDCYDPNEGA